MVPVTTKQIKILLTRLLVSVVLYWIGLFKDSESRVKKFVAPRSYSTSGAYST
jgi:hypothetical protein